MSRTQEQTYRWFCQCIANTGERVYLVATAASEAEASQLIHINYAIDYVEDIRTPDEMRIHTHYLRPTLIGIAQFVPWWTSGSTSNGQAISKVAEKTGEGTQYGTSTAQGIS